jgi:hypothetical protein
VALRLGYVQPRQLEQAARAGKPIGKALVDAGALTSADLWKCIHEQVAVVFRGVLLAREGVFTLIDETNLELASALSMNTQALLMDGIRRLDEMALFRARIPGPDVHVRRRPGRVTTGLDPTEQKALVLLEAPRRVLEVAQALRLDEVEATRILYHLVESGHLEVVTEPVDSPEVQASRAATLVSGMNEILRLVLAGVSATGGRDRFLSGVRSFLSDPLNRFAAVWHEVASTADGSVDSARVLRNVAALDPPTLASVAGTPDRSRYLYEALSELMFFYLFQAGELLPPGGDELLGREVKQRLEALGSLR